MEPQCTQPYRNLALHRPFIGFRHRTHFSLPLTSPPSSAAPRVSCNSSGDRRRSTHGGKQRGAGEVVKSKKKENMWSIDNELEARASREEKGSVQRRRGRRAKGAGRRGRNSMVLVSEAMSMEIETVLQTQEPVIKPAWNTFASSVSGIWKGVGAVFSPFTAEMEPIGVGNQNENLYDCYTLSHIEKAPSEGPCSQIRRKTKWVALNPFGEKQQHPKGSYRNIDRDRSVTEKVTSDVVGTDPSLPSYESFDFAKSEVLEEDSMSMEPGLVFFEDGSYSRGPVDIPVGGLNESKYFLSPTFKFEQCLVKGCHKRLRIVHTIEFNEGGSNIQIIRVAVYEEQWVSPANLYEESDDDLFGVKPISQRRRTQPSELTGSWKVFEVSATPIFGEEAELEEVDGGPPYVYLCTETLKKRSLPENPAYFGEEEMLDMQDVTVLWLPGGVTGYVDVKEDGILCIGVGWYSEEGLNLVMERDYSIDGKLKEVRSKSEVKRRWTTD